MALWLITGLLALSAVGNMGSSCNGQARRSEKGMGETDRLKGLSRVVYKTSGTKQPGGAGAGAAKTVVGMNVARVSARV